MSITLVIVVLFLAVAAVLAVRAGKAIVAKTYTCEVSQIPTVFERLKKEGKDGSFAVLMFQPPNEPNADDAINIQFSIEGGRIGADWCLLGPSNVRDKEKFEHFAASLGYKIRSEEMNQVSYLRIEEGDLPRLCQKVVCDVYAKPHDTKLDMIIEGFSWP